MYHILVTDFRKIIDFSNIFLVITKKNILYIINVYKFR